MRLRRVVDRDIERFYGPLRAAAFLEKYPVYYMDLGERNGAIYGMGGVCWDRDGKCWAFCSVPPRRYAVTLHRAASDILASAKEVNDAIFAYREDNDTSERWLRHFGFQYTHNDGDVEVWAWQRSAQ